MQGRLEVVEAVSPDLQMQHDHRRLRQSLKIKLDLRQLPKEERENERERERERDQGQCTKGNTENLITSGSKYTLPTTNTLQVYILTERETLCVSLLPQV